MEKFRLTNSLGDNINLSSQAIQEINYLQDCENEVLDIYIQHCYILIGVLIETGGKMKKSESKNEIFELIKTTFDIQNLLVTLKA